MPYINGVERANLAAGPTPTTAGQLNYLITKLCTTYIAQRGKDYDTINTVVGVLESAKLELYRRVAAPYEDARKQENGDVYHV